MFLKTLNAQTDFRPGYVIENSNDTILGYIDYRSDLKMSSICRFKKSDNSIIDYSPIDIKAFRFIDNKFYISKEVNEKRVFLEYLINGIVSIYYMRDSIGDRYYIEKEDLALTEILYNEEIQYIDDKKVFYKSTRHIGLLSLYMNDAPGLHSKIKSIKKPDHNNLIEIAEDYHNLICLTEECIIYQKPKAFLKFDFEFVSGLANFPNVEKIKDKYLFQSGLIINVGLQRINEKIIFKTGILINDAVSGDLAYLFVPIQIGYLAPHTYKIRPSASIGLLSPSYSLGVHAKINNKIFMGINGYAFFSPKEKSFYIPEKLNSYSILGSILFSF